MLQRVGQVASVHADDGSVRLLCVKVNLFEARQAADCGDDCQCALCPGVAVKGKTIEVKVEHALMLAGLAGLALGYALGKRGAK